MKAKNPRMLKGTEKIIAKRRKCITKYKSTKRNIKECREVQYSTPTTECSFKGNF